MKDFKFLSDDYDGYTPLPENMASWIWDFNDNISVTSNSNYILVWGTFNGISEFLSQFPENYIVVINSITGVESGITHTSFSRRDGWGFNIQRDQITVVYYNFLPHGEIESV